MKTEHSITKGQTEDPDPEKHPVPLRLCSKMIEWINNFQISVNIVQIFCNPALRDRHWIEMSDIAGNRNHLTLNTFKSM